MRSRFRTLVGLGCALAVTWVGAACSSPAPAEGDTSPCGAYFDALSKRAVACSVERGTPLYPSSDLHPDNRAAYVQYCTGLAAAPGSGAAPAFLRACATAIDAQPAGCLPGDPEGLPACKEPAGTQPLAAGCSMNAQCQSGYCAEGKGKPGAPPFCGACAAVPGEGEACAKNGRVCGADLRCIDGTCRREPAPLPAGASCVSPDGDDLPCQWGLACLRTAGASPQSGVCGALPVAGQACTERCRDPFLCDAGTCVDRVGEGGACPIGDECKLDLFCDASKTCRARSVAPEGAACGAPGVRCDGTLACVRSGTSSVCTRRLPIGAACREGAGAPCTKFAQCVDGACRYQDPKSCL